MVDVQRVKIVDLDILRRKPLVVPVLDPGTEKVVTPRKLESHHPNLEVRNHVSCMRRGSAMEQPVLTNMTMMQHPQRLDQERQRPLLPRPPKPKVPEWS